MPADLRLWIETTHHAAFRYGGWAYARDGEGAAIGYAGGLRNVMGPRIDLSALIAALAGLTAGGPVVVRTSSPSLLAIGRLIVAPPPPGSPDAPTEDLDLWAQALAMARGRMISVVAAPSGPQTPAAFLAAWAEVGQNKAKSAGKFSAAIPKSNLAKLKLA